MKNCLGCAHFRFQMADYDGEYLTKEFFCGCTRGRWEMESHHWTDSFREFIRKSSGCTDFEKEP